MTGRSPLFQFRRLSFWRAVTLVVAAVGGIGLFGVGAAHAQNALVSSNPADNASLPSSPTSMSFVLLDPVGPTNTAAATCGGNPFSVGKPNVGSDGRTVNVSVPNPMPKGTCKVVLFVSAPDGSPNGQVSISFTITAATAATTAPDTTLADGAVAGGGTSTTVAGGGTTDSSASAPSIDRLGGVLGLARLITTLGLSVLLGSIVLIVVAWPDGLDYVLTARFLRSAWWVSLAGSVLMAGTLTAQISGKSLGSAMVPLSWTHLTDTTPGIAALLRVVLVAGCGWVVLQPDRIIDSATQLPAVALPSLAMVTFAFTRTGGDLAAIGTLMSIGHVLAISVWFGGLVLLARVVLASHGDADLVHAVRGFGRIATPAILVTVVTGAVQTFRLDSGSLFSSGHGRVLLLKAVVVGAMVFVGFATRQFVNSQLSRADVLSAGMAQRLRRATGMEALAGVLVLVLTSWLVSFTPPNLMPKVDTAKYGYTNGHFISGDLDVKVLLTGKVGPNGVRVEVAKPSSGLKNFVITFIPPVGTSAPTVVLTVPAKMTGAGVAVLDEADGVPLTAPGVWTLAVSAVTPTGTQTAQKSFTLVGQ